MSLTATPEPELRNVQLVWGPVPATAATAHVSRVGPSDTVADVRGWTNATVAPGATLAIRDYEAPLGVELTYTVQPKTGAGALLAAETVTITVPAAGCADTWLTDLIRAQNTMRVVIETLAELAYETPATVHEIITRRAPIVTSDIAHTPSFELSILTDTLEQRDKAKAAFGNGVPVLLRTPPEHGIGNLYMAVLGFSEQRIVADGVAPYRRFVVTAREVDRPSPSRWAPTAPTTYPEVKARFATYADMTAQRANYDAVLYDWTGEGAGDVVPWPPHDV